jgi:hypothetical protein
MRAKDRGPKGPGEATGGVHIGSAGVVVVDLGREEFKDTLRGFRRGCKKRRRLELRRRCRTGFGQVFQKNKALLCRLIPDT